MGADPATADDMAQDAFFAAFQRIGQLRGEVAFEAWIKTIAARLYLKRRRKAARTVLMAETPEPEAEVALFPGAQIDLDRALMGLSEAERLCVSLCCGAGFSHGEAADALQVPLGTVKSHVKRGLDKLKRRLVEPERTAGHG